MAFQLVEVLKEFWRVRGLYSEGRTFLERALAVEKELQPPCVQGVERRRELLHIRVTIIRQRHFARRVSSCTGARGHSWHRFLPPGA